MQKPARSSICWPRWWREQQPIPRVDRRALWSDFKRRLAETAFCCARFEVDFLASWVQRTDAAFEGIPDTRNNATFLPQGGARVFTGANRFAIGRNPDHSRADVQTADAACAHRVLGGAGRAAPPGAPAASG